MIVKTVVMPCGLKIDIYDTGGIAYLYTQYEDLIEAGKLTRDELDLFIEQNT
jgi:hypothetical protein